MQFNLPICSSLCAYILWGLMPIFWHELKGFSSIEVVAHRVLWSLILLTLIVFVHMRKNPLSQIKLRELLITVVSGLMLAINWSIFIYAIPNGHTLASSLGYFLSPFLMTLTGALLFSEKISGLRFVSLIFMLAALLPLIFGADLTTFFIAVGLALSWIGYSSIRRLSTLGSLQSLWLETFLMTPLALLFLISLYQIDEHLKYSLANWWLLALCGPITLVPLLFYGIAVKKVNFSSLAAMHYLVPLLQLCCAVFIFHEEVSSAKILALALVLCALLISSYPSAKTAFHRILSRSRWKAIHIRYSILDKVKDH